MNKSIGDFVEQYVDGEPLTSRTVAWAIRKYIYMNYGPSKQEELERYKQLLHKLAYLYEKGDEETIHTILKNIYFWSMARKNPPPDTDDGEIECRKNETFYSLPN
jgi:hypothetical protein